MMNLFLSFRLQQVFWLPLTLAALVACGGLVDSGPPGEWERPLGELAGGGGPGSSPGGISGLGGFWGSGGGANLNVGGAVFATGGAVFAAGGVALAPGGSTFVPGLGGLPSAPGGAPMGVGGQGSGGATFVEPTGCDAPIDIGSAVNVQYEGYLDQSKLDSVSGSCGGYGQAAVFLFHAAEDGRYTFDTRNSSIDTVLSLREESCDGSEIICNDDAFDTQSAVSTELVAGQVVALVVQEFSGYTGEFSLSVRQYDEPSGCGEELGERLGAPLVSEVIELVDSSGEIWNECQGSRPLARYIWTAPSSDWFEFSTIGSNFDTVLTLKDGCGGPEITCNDDSNGGYSIASRISHYVEEGQEIAVEISAFSGYPYFDGPEPFLRLDIVED